MPESLRTRSYLDRPSNQLGVWDYFKNSAIYVLLPVIGFGAGLALRKLTKIPALQTPQDPFAIFKGSAYRQNLREAAENIKGYIPRNGEMWGFGIGGIYGAYSLWRNGRKEQLDVGTITDSVQKLRGMESANQFLSTENEQLRKQISFRDRLAAEPAHSEEPQR